MRYCHIIGFVVTLRALSFAEGLSFEIAINFDRHEDHYVLGAHGNRRPNDEELECRQLSLCMEIEGIIMQVQFSSL